MIKEHERDNGREREREGEREKGREREGGKETGWWGRNTSKTEKYRRAEPQTILYLTQAHVESAIRIPRLSVCSHVSGCIPAAP